MKTLGKLLFAALWVLAVIMVAQAAINAPTVEARVLACAMLLIAAVLFVRGWVGKARGRC